MAAFTAQFASNKLHGGARQGEAMMSAASRFALMLTAGTFALGTAHAQYRFKLEPPSLTPSLPTSTAPPLAVPIAGAALDPSWQVVTQPAAASEAPPPMPPIPTAVWRSRGAEYSREALLEQLQKWREYCALQGVYLSIDRLFATIGIMGQRGRGNSMDRTIAVETMPGSLGELGNCMSAQLRLLQALHDFPHDREPSIRPVPTQWSDEARAALQAPNADFDVHISDSAPAKESILVTNPATQMDLSRWEPRDAPCLPRQIERAKWIYTPIDVGFDNQGNPVRNYYYQKFTYVVDDYSHCR